MLRFVPPALARPTHVHGPTRTAAAIGTLSTRLIHCTPARASCQARYDPARVPPAQSLRRHLEWMWRRPDPVPLPRTIDRVLDLGTASASTAQSSTVTLSTLVRRRPLHEYLPANASPALVDRALPPRVYCAQHGCYGPRPLSLDERRAIVGEKLKLSTAATVYGADGTSSNSTANTTSSIDAIALKYKCSRAQVVALVKRCVEANHVVQRGDDLALESTLDLDRVLMAKSQTKNPFRVRHMQGKWRWWHGKKYARAV